LAEGDPLLRTTRQLLLQLLGTMGSVPEAVVESAWLGDDAWGRRWAVQWGRPALPPGRHGRLVEAALAADSDDGLFLAAVVSAGPQGHGEAAPAAFARAARLFVEGDRSTRAAAARALLALGAALEDDDPATGPGAPDLAFAAEEAGLDERLRLRALLQPPGLGR
jgi:hypothetical protein